MRVRCDATAVLIIQFHSFQYRNDTNRTTQCLVDAVQSQERNEIRSNYERHCCLCEDREGEFIIKESYRSPAIIIAHRLQITEIFECGKTFDGICRTNCIVLGAIDSGQSNAGIVFECFSGRSIFGLGFLAMATPCFALKSNQIIGNSLN